MNYILNLRLSINFSIGIILEIISIYYYRDTKLHNEWGIMLENLEKIKF